MNSASAPFNHEFNHEIIRLHVCAYAYYAYIIFSFITGNEQINKYAQYYVERRNLYRSAS